MQLKSGERKRIESERFKVAIKSSPRTIGAKLHRNFGESLSEFWGGFGIRKELEITVLGGLSVKRRDGISFETDWSLRSFDGIGA